MKTNQFSIRNHCIHAKSCVLTSQNEKVFSCSEYDDEPINEHLVKEDIMISQESRAPKLELQMAG